MSFETVSLLMNWFEMGALLAILFRLARTFDLIASTQRELRRAIHNLGARRAAELSMAEDIEAGAIEMRHPSFCARHSSRDHGPLAGALEYAPRSRSCYRCCSAGASGSGPSRPGCATTPASADMRAHRQRARRAAGAVRQSSPLP